MSSATDSDRQVEIEKYRTCYRDRRYGMGKPRRRFTEWVLQRLPIRGSLLDVGAGRGETIEIATACGFGPVTGTEVVPDLLGPSIHEAPAWALPFEDERFDIVTCLDVLEHILPEDAGRSIAEIRRVTRKVAVFSIANHSSVWHGMQLHVNRAPFDWWHEQLQGAFGRVERLENRFGVRNANWLCWTR